MHTTRRLATVLGFASVGMLIAVWLHDYTIEVVHHCAEALSLTHDSVRLIKIGEVIESTLSGESKPIMAQYKWLDRLPIGTKLYTIVKGEAG